MRQWLIDVPDSTTACSSCPDPRPGAWSEWGRDARKRAVVSEVDLLLALLPGLDPEGLQAHLDAIERLATERGEGILNEMARDELVVMLRGISASASSSGAAR